MFAKLSSLGVIPRSFLPYTLPHTLGPVTNWEKIQISWYQMDTIGPLSSSWEMNMVKYENMWVECTTWSTDNGWATANKTENISDEWNEQYGTKVLHNHVSLSKVCPSVMFFPTKGRLLGIISISSWKKVKWKALNVCFLFTEKISRSTSN